MKILITLLLALFISGQAIALDSFEILSKGKIIYQTEDKSKSIKFINFFVIYKKSFWKCESITMVNLGEGTFNCQEQTSSPARDKEGEYITD
jgi:hypothetical protein